MTKYRIDYVNWGNEWVASPLVFSSMTEAELYAIKYLPNITTKVVPVVA